MKDDKKIHDFPLHVYGDAITDALEASGVPNAGVLIAVVNGDTGKVASTSNMERAAQLAFLQFMKTSIIDGTISEEEQGGETVQ